MFQKSKRKQGAGRRGDVIHCCNDKRNLEESCDKYRAHEAANKCNKLGVLVSDILEK